MTVANKLWQVYKAVGGLKKDKQVSGAGMNYAFLSEEKVTTELHEEFAKVGLVIMPVGMSLEGAREDTTRSGSVLHNAVIKVRYRLIDPEDGDAQEVEAFGEGSDSGDKTMNKCMTAAFKYALRQTCMISTGDDPDQHASEESTHSRPAQTRSTSYQPNAARPSATPQAASASSVPQPQQYENSKQGLWKMLNDIGWTEEGADGKGKPTQDFWKIVHACGVPNKYGSWSDEERGQVMHAIAVEIGKRAPAGQASFDEFGDPGDPFADQ